MATSDLAMLGISKKQLQLSVHTSWASPNSDDLQEGKEEQAVFHNGIYLGKEVAVRSFRGRGLADDPDWKRAIRELSNLRHPNLALFMGVVPHPRGCHIVSESIPASRLRAWLERPTPASNSSAPPGMPALLRVAHGVAAALSYLHGHKVWHLHLQPAAIFVDGGILGAKVADYALGMFESCLRPATNHDRLRRCSPWTPPEVLRMSGRPVQEAAVDVYAFGVVLWEMLTGRQPYAGLTAAACRGCGLLPAEAA